MNDNRRPSLSEAMRDLKAALLSVYGPPIMRLLDWLSRRLGGTS